MEQKYEIRHWQDTNYAVYLTGEYEDYLYRGSIEEVSAWITLKEKGFNFN